MQLRFGTRIFRPGLAATVATLVLLPLLINLGFWQLNRAAEKRALMAEAATGKQTTLLLQSATAAQLKRYQHVQVQGRFDSQHQVLLDNMPAKTGQPGYRVLTPLLLEDQSIVLVDRGWLALGVNRNQLPQIAVAEEPRTLTGILDVLPQPGVRAGNAGIAPDRWPQVLNYPRYAELRQLYGSRLQERLVLLDADAPDGFERAWQINIGFGPERHVAYAVQWFALAAALLIIYLVVNLKRSNESSGDIHV